MVAAQLIACLVFLPLFSPLVSAHGYLSKPISRNYYEYTQSRFWNRKWPEYCLKTIHVACSSLTCGQQLDGVAALVPHALIYLLLVEAAGLGLLPGKQHVATITNCSSMAADMSGNGGVPGSVPGWYPLLLPWRIGATLLHLFTPVGPIYPAWQKQHKHVLSGTELHAYVLQLHSSTSSSSSRQGLCCAALSRQQCCQQ
jgi:hypothetical protein